MVIEMSSGDRLAAFMLELEDVLDRAVGIENLFDGDLGALTRDAWASVKEGLAESRDVVANESEDALAGVGLAGAQLDFKMRAWRFHRERWDTDLRQWQADVADDSLSDRLKHVSSKLLRLASTILGSLLSIGALPGVEALREIVDTLESLL